MGTIPTYEAPRHGTLADDARGSVVTGRPPGSGLVIDARDVVKSFGERIAVNGLTLSIPAGEIFGLLGPNGSGKTTTFNLLTGLSRLTGGRIHVLGHDVSVHPQRIRAELGAVPQETALYEELTPVHNLRLHADLYGVPRGIRDRRIEEVLDLVHLSDRRSSRVRTFSGGMKRRLALARALLHDPSLIILDEPTLGVDVQSRRALWDRILELKRGGKTILITTNYLEEAGTLCDRVAIMDHGRLVALDTPAGLRAKYGRPTLELVTVRPAGDDVLEHVRGVAGVLQAGADGRSLTVVMDGREDTAGTVVTGVARTCGITSIEQHEATLDAVFLHLTGRDMRDSNGP